MNKIVTFENFLKKPSEISEFDGLTQEGHDGHENHHYMFFQNLTSIKHYVEEILAMDPAKVDMMLQDGHDWASDHVTSSKDDVQEVAEWLRNTMEMQGSDSEHTPEEPESVAVNVEGDDDKVEVEIEDEDEE
jgi:hypothetical protein